MKQLLYVCMLFAAVLCSPVTWAATCGEVFPTGAKNSGVALDLSIMSGQNYLPFPSSGENFTTAGDKFFYGGSLDTWSNINVVAGQTTRIFVDGPLNLQPNSSINRSGNPANLIIIVRGTLNIGTKNDINALIYATGDVILNSQVDILGAVTSQGTISIGSQSDITYSPTAASSAALSGLTGLCSDGRVNHYRLSYSNNALTCRPHSIMVTACSNADCSATYTSGNSTLTITPGGSPISFTGSTVTTLAIRTEQTVVLSVSGGSPSASSPLLCRIDGGAASANCSLRFNDSGLLVEAPDLLARNTDTLRISAVRKGTSSLECVPAFADVTREVQLWTTHLDPRPSELIGSPQLFMDVMGDDDPAISTNAANPSLFELAFGSTGQASLPIRYDDAGLLQLNARYVGSVAHQDSGLLMEGDAQFVSKPYGFHISIPGQDSICSAATVDDCAALSVNGQRVMAGDPFGLRVRAVAWVRDDQPRTADELEKNPATPNFRLVDNKIVTLTSTLAAPRPEDDGVMGVLYQHAADGTRAPLNSYEHVSATTELHHLSQSEVGIFRLNAVPPNFHGRSINGGEALIGRFTPAWLGVSSDASLQHSCSTFSYQGRLINFTGERPTIQVTAFNRQGAPTRNYDLGAFWRLISAPQRQDYALVVPASLNLPDRSSLAGRLASLGDGQSLPAMTDTPADGSRVFEWREEGIRQADALRWAMPALASDADLPLNLSAGDGLLQLRVAQAQLTDLDDVCYRGSDSAEDECQDFVHTFGGTELRLGRLQIEDHSAAETQSLDLPYWLQYMSDWNPSATGQDREVWTKNGDDSCSTPLLGDVLLIASSFTDDLTAADFPNPPGTLVPQSGAMQPSGLIRLPAPNKQGSVLVSLSGLHGQAGPPEVAPLLPWLLYNWKDHSRVDDGLKAPMGKATFGSQSNRRPEIFRREIYR